MPAAIASTPARPVVETEWTAMNASVYLLTSTQAERLTVTTLSDFLISEFLGGKASPIIVFREEIQYLMWTVPSWSQYPNLYQAVRANKLFINGGIVNLFMNNIWAAASFASSQCALDEAMSLYLWCPGNMQSAVFQEKDGDVIRANIAARMGTNKGKAAKEVPLLPNCTCLMDVVSELLLISAAARLCYNEVEDHVPALPWLLDFTASTIATEEIEDTLSDQAHREELLRRYLLHELQEIFCAYVKGVTHYKQKSMVNNNSCVRSSTWNTAATAIMDLPRKIKRLVNANLNATGLIMLTCGKPSAQVTQVKQVSQTE